MEHSRCPAHGLIIVADGLCTRCRRDEDRTSSARTYALLGAAGVVVLMLLAGWRAISMTMATSAGQAATPATTSAATADPRTGRVVTVFTTGHCPWCRKAKTWLDEHQIAYTERRVDEDRAAADEMGRIAGGGGVPAFVVDGQVHRGYSVKWLEETARFRLAGEHVIRNRPLG